ncbi:MAG TPA: SgcJ/EcaC family oxidoreductase [Rudaea sp.]
MRRIAAIAVSIALATACRHEPPRVATPAPTATSAAPAAPTATPSPPIAPTKSAERARVEAAFERFRQTLIAMNPDAVAALFAADGQIINEGQEPLQGREAIGKFLEGFTRYTILSYDAANIETTLEGDSATLIADYHERVRTPEGKVVDASGHLNSEWVRDGSGAWLIRRMTTTPHG